MDSVRLQFKHQPITRRHFFRSLRRSNYLECQQRNIYGWGRKIPMIKVTSYYFEGQKIEFAVSFPVKNQFV